MKFENWKEIELKLQNKIIEIFINYNLNNLSNYTQRKIIFNYLCKTLKYDFSLLNKIKEYNTIVVRDPYKELESVIDNNIGICNAISQYYKLLLEQVGIKSYCVVCDDGTEVKHQLNLVYDEEKDMYSFDDITSIIVGRGNQSTFFNYDLKQANNLNQGNKILFKNYKWIIIDEDYINKLMGRKTSPYQSINSLSPESILIKQYKRKR